MMRQSLANQYKPPQQNMMGIRKPTATLKSGPIQPKPPIQTNTPMAPPPTGINTGPSMMPATPMGMAPRPMGLPQQPNGMIGSSPNEGMGPNPINPVISPQGINTGPSMMPPMQYSNPGLQMASNPMSTNSPLSNMYRKPAQQGIF